MESIVNFEPRQYQKSIFEACKEKNCLVILPTGIGKTAISLLLTIHRLNEFPDSKALICSPTKPLCNQHVKTFSEHTTIHNKEIILYTGLIKPDDRKDIFKKGRVIIATPQTIEKDLENGKISLKDFSTLTIDEAHRSRMAYANTTVARLYLQQANNPRVLALTASPGFSKEKINEIMENLYIEAVEIRTEYDDEVRPYVKEKKVTWEEVELPEDFKEIISKLKNIYKERVGRLKNFGLTKPASLISKRDLLSFQRNMQGEIQKGNKAAFSAISLIAQCIKLDYAIELIETQGLRQFNEFIGKLAVEDTKAAKVISSTKEIKDIMLLTESLINKGIIHSKMEKLKLITSDLINKNSGIKIMIFANYRNTVKGIVSLLSDIKGLKPIELMGQKEGITQKKQLETIKEFEEGKYNVLVGTSISEEGLDIKGGADIAIFYDAVPSEIRKKQRSGRVGRLKAGDIINLIAKGTRDEAYRWVSYKKEKSMKNIIERMQKEKQSRLI